MLFDNAKALSLWLRNHDIKEYAADELTSVIAAALTNDPASEVVAIRKTITDVAHLPTFIFWCKMEQFLRGTFHSFEDQVKMANKFDPTTDGYARFVAKLITVLDQIEDCEKVDFYANLSRAFLLECIKSETLFHKLAKFILICTYDELCFIRDCPYEYAEPNSVMISALLQYGLFEQGETVDGKTRYKLSGFAKALKQSSLNFNPELHGMKRITGYEDIEPIETFEPISSQDILDIFNSSDEEIILNGGTAEDLLKKQND